MSVFKWAGAIAAACLTTATVSSAAVYSFQDGIDGYDGTQDATLYPGVVDGEMNTGGSGVIYANQGAAIQIIKFDVSSLAGLTVTGPATLTFTIADTSVGPDTIYPGPEFLAFTVHSITDANAGWVQGNNSYGPPADAGEVTYNNKAYPATPWAGSAGLSTSGTDYDAVAVATGLYDQKGTAEGAPLSITLPASLIQHWIDVNNAGLRIRVEPHEGYGAVQFYSSEYSTSHRPKLEVTAVPEPASIGLLGMIGAGLLARRRGK